MTSFQKRRQKAVLLKREIERYKSQEFREEYGDVSEISSEVLTVDLINMCQPTFEKVLKNALHKRGKGYLTSEQKQSIRTIIKSKNVKKSNQAFRIGATSPRRFKGTRHTFRI